MAASMWWPISAAAANSDPAWHEAALKTNRQHAYDDFEAVAADLARRGLTTPKQLGIMGGSNGGLLVSTVMVQTAGAVRRRGLPGAADRHDRLHPYRRGRVLDRGIWRSRRSRRSAITFSPIRRIRM